MSIKRIWWENERHLHYAHTNIYTLSHANTHRYINLMYVLMFRDQAHAWWRRHADIFVLPQSSTVFCRILVLENSLF